MILPRSPGKIERQEEKGMLFQQVREALRRQKGAEAFSLLCRLSFLDLSHGERKQVRSFMKEVKDLLPAENFCPGWCEWEQEWYSGDDTVSFVLILENLTSTHLTFFPLTSEGHPQLQVHFKYREFDPLGPVVEMEWNRIIPLHEEISLPPKERWQYRIVIPMSEIRAQLPLYKRIKVRGEILLPSLVEIPLEGGEGLGFNRFHFSSAETEIFPEGIEAIIPDPEAYLLRSAELAPKEPKVLNNAFVAALYFSREDLPRCVSCMLETWKGSEEALNKTFLSVLPLITGCEELASRQDWIQWWERDGATLPARRPSLGPSSLARKDPPHE